jgi:hypothetical protein
LTRHEILGIIELVFFEERAENNRNILWIIVISDKIY